MQVFQEEIIDEKYSESSKQYLDINVLEATKGRLWFVLDNFKNICISFSGGKDSTILLHLVREYLKHKPELKTKKNLFIYHLDYEAQYNQTTKFVQQTLQECKKEGFKIFYICMPFKAQCACSMYQTYWRPWAIEDKDKWLREPPGYSITEENHSFDFWSRDLSDCAFNVELLLKLILIIASIE
ncbi:phosphoadenosine phosphosulfate reductase family protein [Helicobacter sp. 11S03491-1]|uniref:phosphoadenosine phosphosulfate reductase domain-containing protein n=1 Tax=Helicobacter sp. 11S03491-1 TaxID=1476196 RepID=UPI0015DABAF7|nr:phosphoadenosine phosphosulfate reductase family protein [Helicobacter sp. 11S03491-1]